MEHKYYNSEGLPENNFPITQAFIEGAGLSKTDIYRLTLSHTFSFFL